MSHKRSRATRWFLRLVANCKRNRRSWATALGSSEVQAVWLLWGVGGGLKVKGTTLRNAFVSCAVALALVIGAITPAFAIGVSCGNLCRATVSFLGESHDAPISIDERGIGTVSNFSVTVRGVTAGISSAMLIPDPAILLSGSATNLTAAPVLLTFLFSTPIALSGAIDASSSIGYTLTDGFPAALGGSPGVVLSSGAGTDPNHVLVANDVGLPPAGLITNKGVDVGPFVNDPPGGIPGTCTAFTAGAAATSVCGPFSASNTFSGGPFVLMTAQVSFFLSAEDAVSFSGSVVQNTAAGGGTVPEPASLLLMVTGLLGLAGWRRYSSRA